MPWPSMRITRIVGTPAEEVDVDDRERADREEDGAGEAAEDRQEQRRHEDDRLDDEEDLHVDEERARDLRERVAVVAPVEEVRLERVPAGRLRDDDDDRAEDDDRREDGDRDRPRLARAAGGRAAEDPGAPVPVQACYFRSGAPARARYASGAS